VLKPGLVIHSIYNGYWFWGRPSQRKPAGLTGNSSTPSSPPMGSSAAATCMSAWLDAAGLARRISVNSEPSAAADAQVWSIVELWDVLPGERAVPGAVTLAGDPKPLGSEAGKCQETGLTMEWIRVCCSTSALSCLPRMPNSSMALATRWMLAWTTGPTG
jgi:hypothetical protein